MGQLQPPDENGLGDDEELDVAAIPREAEGPPIHNPVLGAATLEPEKWGGEDWVRVGLGAVVIGIWVIFVLGSFVFAWIHPSSFQGVFQVLASGVTAILGTVIGFYFGERSR